MIEDMKNLFIEVDEKFALKEKGFEEKIERIENEH